MPGAGTSFHAAAAPVITAIGFNQALVSQRVGCLARRGVSELLSRRIHRSDSLNKMTPLD
jgi:hypothetical protein